MLHWFIFNALVLILSVGYLLKDGTGFLGFVAWILLCLSVLLMIKDFLILGH